MDRVKEIELKVIPSDIANRFIRKHHYSGKVVNNSRLHFGAFLDKKLHGVLSYGPSMFQRQCVGLVKGLEYDGMLELNRMAFDDQLPRNSESFCIAKSIKLIKKYAPQVKVIISFADGCSCGDGTIYRASNFVLTGIKENKKMCLLPSGEKVHRMAIESGCDIKRPELGGKTYYEITNGKYDFNKYVEVTGGKIIPGYMLRYMYFIDKSYLNKLKVKIIPFSDIDKYGAGMYKGEHITREERHNKLSDEQLMGGDKYGRT